MHGYYFDHTGRTCTWKGLLAQTGDTSRIRSSTEGLVISGTMSNTLGGGDRLRAPIEGFLFFGGMQNGNGPIIFFSDSRRPS
jgi:hypothetical protein